MDGERHIREVLRAGSDIQTELEVVVVIYRSAHDLERLISRLTR